MAFAQLVSWGVINYGFAAFVVPLESDLGWSRQSLMAALTIGLLTAGLVTPLVGRWIDVRGGRTAMTFGTLLAAAMLAVWSLTSDYLVFCLSWIGLGIAQALTLYEPAFALLHRELKGAAPRAIVRVTLVAGLAGTVFIPLGYWLIELFGWRQSALLLAAILLLSCLPVYARLPPGPNVPAPTFTRARRSNGNLRQAIRTRPFWGLLISFAGGAFVYGVITFHIVPLLFERGLDGAEAMLVVAAIGPSQVIGRLGVFLFWKDIKARLLGRIISLALPLVLILFLYIPGFLGALLFAALYGLCNGQATIVRGIAAADFLGREGFGAVNGAIVAPAAFSRALAPMLAGSIWAFYGGYQMVLWALIIMAVCSACGFWWASSGPQLREMAPVRAGGA